MHLITQKLQALTLSKDNFGDVRRDARNDVIDGQQHQNEVLCLEKTHCQANRSGFKLFSKRNVRETIKMIEKPLPVNLVIDVTQVANKRAGENVVRPHGQSEAHDVQDVQK